MGGVQVRGKNAKTLQLIYFSFILALNAIKLFWYIFINFIWFSFLIIKWIFGFFVGFYKGFKTNPKEIKVESQ